VVKLLSICFLFIVILFPVEKAVSDTLIIDGSTGVKPLVKALVKEYEIKYKKTKRFPKIQIGKGLKPSDRILALKDNKIDIAMASHGIDIQKTSKAGLKVHPIAKVAVVIGVNHTVNIDAITHQQLCDVYRGKIANWQYLGGSNMTIIPLLRPFNEVDTEVVSAHVPCFSPSDFSKNIRSIQKSGKMARMLSHTRGAVGMTTLIRVAQSHGAIKAMAINNIKPEPENLLNGSYPLSRDLFLITESQPKAEVAAFLAFVNSVQGAEIITANHAVPIELGHE
jgi:phosphate transport system substrate-binding protein